MPAKVANAAAAHASQVASKELTEIKDIKAANQKMVIADKQSQQQFKSAENKMVNNTCEENLQMPKQTDETSAVLSANTRSKYQPQPDTYVIYPQYQSYVTPPSIHAMSVPGATTIPPGQQQVLPRQQTQYGPPSYQVAYQPPMNSCEGDPVVPNEQPYQANYEFMSQPLQTCPDAQLCQYGWQYHSPSMMSPHQPYLDPCQTFNQFQQAVGLPTLRTPYGYTAFQGVPPDPSKQYHRYRNQNQHDPKSSSIACQKDLEYYCNCDCQVQPAGQISVAQKEPEKTTHRANIPSTTTERANANHTRSARSSNDFTKVQTSARKELKNPVSDLAQGVSAIPSISVRTAESVGNREWYHRENNLSSDSGWISDNSSNKEDGELVDDLASLSPTINEISSHFQHSLCLENSTSSSTDESYQESQPSPISSHCPSTSDDSEQQQHTPTKKHPQQPRIMRAIPSRFVNLLHTAAENAALQRKRLEGYPLFRQMMLQRRYEDHQQDQVCGPEVQQLEFSLTNQPNQSNSWYFPGGYIQFQYHQNPANYIHGQYPQGAGPLQGPYQQGATGGYTQGQQGPGCYVQNQQGPGGYMQNNYNQGNENYPQSQYNQGSFGYTQASASYMCSDQQCGQEYCHAAQAVPVYVIQVDNPDVANSCILYNDGRSYAGSQAVYEKQPQSYTYNSNPGYANPVPMQ